MFSIECELIGNYYQTSNFIRDRLATATYLRHIKTCTINSV